MVKPKNIVNNFKKYCEKPEIYFLLVLLFKSVTQPFLVIFTIPFGIAGVIIAYALHQEPFSFMGIMGIIGLSGVVVNDSLVLINHINEQRKLRPVRM
jgi:multidrug efflux pump subunit AcrB